MMYEDEELKLWHNLVLSYSVFGKYNQNNPSAHYASHEPTTSCLFSICVNIDIGVWDDIIPDNTVSI